MSRRFAERAVVAVCLLLVSATVLYQQETDGHGVPPRFEVLRHLEWMEGRSELYNPWQYRVLPDLAIEGMVRGFGLFPFFRERAVVKIAPDAPLQRRIFANGWALAPYRALRILLGFAVFVAFMAWLERVGVADLRLRLLGVVLLAYAMGQAHFDSAMAFSSYFDLWLYLLAALAITGGRSDWILALSVLAALNRATGGLIPVMLGAAAIDWPGRRLRDVAALRTAAMSLLAFVVVFVAVRAYFGWQPPSPVYGNQSVPDFVRFNLTNRFTFPELLGTFGIVPALALLGYRRWPRELRVWAWTIVPIWLTLHVSFGLLRETRLLLVPHALIFLPGLLLHFRARSDRESLAS